MSTTSLMIARLMSEMSVMYGEGTGAGTAGSGKLGEGRRPTPYTRHSRRNDHTFPDIVAADSTQSVAAF